ncbi:C40 family peptidase [Nocardioides sp. C4-1]|uniref:C40 family peptidase n=1 Tax=Nocardioides sp. C4-1 TaxID=3151851 RepID=UPI003265FC1B
MRTAAVATALATLAVLGAGGSSARAVEDDVPTRQQVQQAEDAVVAGQRDVDAVRADLVAAREKVATAQLAASKAAEAFNGARYDARQARLDADAARVVETEAQAHSDRLRDVFRRNAVRSLTTHSELAVLSSLADSDGLGELLSRSSAIRVGRQAFTVRNDDLEAAADAASAAREAADQAEDDAVAAADRARVARGEARDAAAGAVAEEQVAAGREQALVAELARLQDVSIAVAQRRESGLERRRAAAEAARRAEEQRQAELAQQAAAAAAQPEPAPAPETASPEPTQDPEPDPEPAPEPPAPETPAPETPAPAPSGGASAAIAFARAQLGDPYRWAASGPDAWDCSGLTAGAWAAGGTSLPHYSVAQYEQSTPISPGELRPGDLVFWGDSSSPSSIYHVALYAGDGMIIHAPRTGRPVTEESMYYWIEPNFYARP